MRGSIRILISLPGHCVIHSEILSPCQFDNNDKRRNEVMHK